MIAVVNSVIGGSAVALAVAATGDPPLGIPVAVGGVTAIASLIAMQRSQMTRFGEALAPRRCSSRRLSRTAIASPVQGQAEVRRWLA
jgi:hypothetical protein